MLYEDVIVSNDHDSAVLETGSFANENGNAAAEAMNRRNTMALLSSREIDGALASLPGWRREKNELRKTYRFPDFVTAIAFVNRIADAAEAVGHHPDLTVGWGRVGVALSTHSEGGITVNDTALASKIEQLAGA